ncbi:AsmA family protein [Methyloversatilis thermotolerans]|uniref:AsmA family protein n=1 Tax=Methyloversatilis thermotolerans TaxID=1346290 RepID=UPI00035D655F|nr:AsmA family protein [Methyloversatilis thermotolerans]
MKIIRYAAFALGSIAALIAAAVLYVAITFDAERLKVELKRVVQEQKQRTLEVEGQVDLSFYPNLGLSLGRVTLSEPGSADRFAELESARVSVAVLPLLSGELVVDEIRIDGARLSAVRLKDGRYNFADLLSNESRDNSPVRFDVAGFRLSNSSLSYRDEASGVELSLDGMQLTVGRIAQTARGKVQLSAHARSARPAADARLTLDASYDYDMVAGRYEIGQVALSLEGEAMDMQNLNGRFSADRLVMSGDGAMQIGKPALELSGRRAEDALSLGAASPAIAFDGSRWQADEAKLAFRLSAPARTVAADLALTGASYVVEDGVSATVTLKLDASEGSRNVKVSVASPVRVRPELPAVELPALEGELLASDPSWPAGSAKLTMNGRAAADFAQKRADLAVEGRLDEEPLSIKLAAMRFEPLALTLDVEAARIDIDRYIAPDTGDAAARPDDAAIDLSPLRALDAGGRVRIGALGAAGLKLDKVAADFKLAKGRLELAPYSAQLYQGRLDGRFIVNAENRRMALTQTLKDVDLHPLLSAAAGVDMLEGRGSLSLDLSGGVSSLAELKSSLAGSARVSLRDGAVRGINLAQSLREARAMLVGGQAAEQKARAGEKTDLSELSASFRIKDGIARNDDLKASSPFLRLAGNGQIDLPASSLDYHARVSVVATSKGQDGRALHDLAGITLPVRLSGPFGDLSYRLEPGNLIKEAARATLQDQGARVRDAATDRLRKGLGEGAGDALKGLIGQ